MAKDRRARHALEGLNFFMADIQAGIGPFLGVFLLEHGWKSGMIGTVMAVGGIAAVLVTTPIGALIDGTSHKRLCVAAAALLAVLGSTIVLLSQELWIIGGSQIATAVAGAAVAPAVAGITLGIVGQAGFNRQTGRNQAFNHAGNMVGAGLSGLLGWQFGYAAVFLLAALLGVLSIASVVMIPAGAIDHQVARGLADGPEDGKTDAWSALWQCKPLVALAAALLLFHLGNAAMLPLYGLAVVAAKQGNGPAFVATTVVVAQGVMIVMSLLAMHMVEKQGFWLVLLISFLSLPIRGMVAAGCIEEWGVVPVQTLDGIGAGLQSVAVPGLVTRLLDGSGRVNVGQGLVMTAQGVGAASSPAIGGWLAERLGYSVAFLILGGLALGSVMIWLMGHRSLRAACRPPSRAIPAGAG